MSVARYRKRLANERLANEELGRRVAALRRESARWQERYEAERAARVLRDSECERLRARLLLLVADTDAENAGISPNTPPRAAKPRLHFCASPRLDRHGASFADEAAAMRESAATEDDDDGDGDEEEEEEEEEEGTPPEIPVRSIEFLLRSSAANPFDAPAPSGSLACACFTSGATYGAAARVKLRASRRKNVVFGRADPVVLSSCGAVDMDAPAVLPDLISDMCFPDGVRLIDKGSNGHHAPNHNGNGNDDVSVFSMTVPTSLSTADIRPLYGIFASIDPRGHLSVIEHIDSGRVLSLPFTVCFLTRQPHFEALAEVLKEIVGIERQRMSRRVDSLRRGELSGDAINVPGPDFGKLGAHAADLVARVLGLDNRAEELEHEAPSAHPLLASVLIARHGLGDRPVSSLPQLFAWGGARLVRAISLERTLVVLGCALTETKIVFMSKNMSMLGSSVLAFSTLLLPLVWSGPLVPVLPTHLLHMLDAPVPLLAGVTRMNRSMFEQREDDTVIVDLDRGRIFLPTMISAAFHNFKMKDLESFCAENEHVEQVDALYDAIHEKVCQLVSSACTADMADAETDPFVANISQTTALSHYQQQHLLEEER